MVRKTWGGWESITADQVTASAPSTEWAWLLFDNQGSEERSRARNAGLIIRMRFSHTLSGGGPRDRRWGLYLASSLMFQMGRCSSVFSIVALLMAIIKIVSGH